MTYEEFISQVKQIAQQKRQNTQLFHGIIDGDNVVTSYNDIPIRKRQEGMQLDYYIYRYWLIGGASGGNCWGDSASNFSEVVSSAETELTLLDDILEEISPNISFLAYRGIAKLTKEGSYTDYEYYGNYSQYAFKTVSLKDLFAYLESKSLIS